MSVQTGPDGQPILTPGFQGPGMGASLFGAMNPMGGKIQDLREQQSMSAGMIAGTAMNSGIYAAQTSLDVMKFAGSSIAPLLAIASSSSMVRTLGWGMTAFDPMGLAMSGAYAGWNAGGGAFTAAGRFSVGRAASSLGLGAVLGATFAAPFALAAQLPVSMMENAFTGMTQGMMGQATIRQFGPQGNGQRASAGQGASLGMEMAGIAKTLGASIDDLTPVIQQLDQAKMFQATRTIGEFRSKLTESLKTIKEIAQATKTGLEEATTVFTEIQGQGFYQRTGITQAASRIAARATASGMSTGTLLQAGSMGAGYARQMGLSGAVGSEVMQSAFATTASTLRNGTEAVRERIAEMGGVEQVSQRIGGMSLQFLGSHVGQSFIAASIDGEGNIDMGRLRDAMGGNRRNLSRMSRQGGRRGWRMAGETDAQEEFAPYAEMALVQSAVMGQRRGAGTHDRGGLYDQFERYGVDQKMADVMMERLRNMPRAFEEQMGAAGLSAGQEGWENARSSASKWQGGQRRWGAYTSAWQKSGAQAWAGLADKTERVIAGFSGYKETTVGPAGAKMARDFVQRGGMKNAGEGDGTFVERTAMFGTASGRDQILQQYGGFTEDLKRTSAEDGSYQYAGADGEVYGADEIVELSGARSNTSIADLFSSVTLKGAAAEHFLGIPAMAGALAQTSSVKGSTVRGISRANLRTAQSVQTRPDRPIGVEAQARMDNLIQYKDYLTADITDGVSGLVRGLLDRRGSGQVKAGGPRGAPGRAGNDQSIRDYEADVLENGTSLSRDAMFYEQVASRKDMDLTKQEINTFAIMKRGGGFTGSFEEFYKMKGSEEKSLTADGKETGRTKKEEFLLLSARAGQMMAASKVSKDVIKQTIGEGGVAGIGLTRETAKADLEVGLREALGDGNEDLIAKASENSEVAAGVSMYMRALAGGSEADKVASLNMLSGMIGKDSVAFQQLNALNKGNRDTQVSAVARWKASGGDDLISQNAAAQMVGRQSDRERGAIARRGRERILRGETGVDPYGKSLQAVMAAGENVDARGAAYNQLYSDIAKDGFNEEERALLNDVVGTSGADVTKMIEDLASGDPKTQDAAMKAMGLNTGDLGDMSKRKDKSGRLQEAVAAMSKKGMLDGAFYQNASGASTTTVDGQTAEAQGEVWQKQTEFVTAVKAFIVTVTDRVPEMKYSGGTTDTRTDAEQLWEQITGA